MVAHEISTILFLFGLPVILMFAFHFLSPWDPIVGADEDGDPTHLAVYVSFAYWASLIVMYQCAKRPSFMPRGLKTLYRALDKAYEVPDGDSFLSQFDNVRRQIEEFIILHPSSWLLALKTKSPEVIVYSAIAKRSGDLAGSGEYHLYRGLLNPLGGGSGLNSLHRGALQELVKLGVISDEDMSDLREELAADIASVG